jgi:hypothetical protein
MRFGRAVLHRLIIPYVSKETVLSCVGFVSWRCSNMRPKTRPGAGSVKALVLVRDCLSLHLFQADSPGAPRGQRNTWWSALIC